MKNILKYIPIFILALVVSCDNDDTGPGSNENLDAAFVEISAAGSSSETFLFGNSSTPTSITVPVTLNSAFNSINLAVGFDVVSVSGQDPSVLFDFPSNAVIPAGSRDGSFVLDVNQDAVITETMVFDVVLTSVSGAGLGLSDDSRNLTHRVTVNTIFIEPEYTGTSSLAGFDSNEFTASLTPVEGEEDTFVVDTCWGDIIGVATGSPGLADVFPYPGILRLNRETLTFTIEGTDPRPNADFQDPADGVPNNVTILPFESPLDQPGTIPDMDGTYDPETDTFTFTLMQSLFGPEVEGPDEEGNFILTFDTATVSITGRE